MVTTLKVGMDACPEATALREFKLITFVDDFLPYLCVVPADIYAALVFCEAHTKRWLT